MFAGLATLIKLILRRDRVKLPVWTICFVVFLLWMIPLLSDMYGDAASLEALYQTLSANAAGIFLTGTMDTPTFGALMTIETLLWWGLAIAFLNILLVVRHTRQNEEMGAQELVQSCRVGRGTSLMAVLIVALLANFVIAIGLGVGMSLMSDAWTSNQAWLYAVTMGLFGMVWAGLAAIVVQLVESARSARGILVGLVGLTFLIRGVGDFLGTKDAGALIQPEWMSSLSPFGWAQATRALTFPDWLPILLPIICIIVSVAVAFFLLHRRDLGAGILPSRKGRSHASTLRKTPLGFAWYVQRNVFIGWFAGVMIFVGVIGLLVPEMSRMFDTSDAAKRLIESIGGAGAMIPAFLSTMLTLTAIAVTGYIVQGLSKLRSEEANGYVENLLATRLSRIKWLAQHAGIVLAGGILMLALSGVILGTATNIWTEYTVDVWSYMLAGLSYVPVLLAFAGAFILLFGVLPRMAGAMIWTYYGFVAFVTWIGPILGLDEWIMNISIMQHFASAPAQGVEAAPLIIATTGGIVAVILGMVAWRNRNLVSD